MKPLRIFVVLFAFKRVMDLLINHGAIISKSENACSRYLFTYL